MNWVEVGRRPQKNKGNRREEEKCGHNLRQRHQLRPQDVQVSTIVGRIPAFPAQAAGLLEHGSKEGCGGRRSALARKKATSDGRPI